MVDAASGGEVAGVSSGLTGLLNRSVREQIARAIRDIPVELDSMQGVVIGADASLEAAGVALETIAPMVEKLLADRENAAAHAAQSAMGSGLDTWRF